MSQVIGVAVIYAYIALMTILCWIAGSRKERQLAREKAEREES